MLCSYILTLTHLKSVLCAEYQQIQLFPQEGKFNLMSPDLEMYIGNMPSMLMFLRQQIFFFFNLLSNVVNSMEYSIYIFWR